MQICHSDLALRHPRPHRLLPNSPLQGVSSVSHRRCCRPGFYPRGSWQPRHGKAVVVVGVLPISSVVLLDTRESLYSLTQYMYGLVSQQLTRVTPVSYLVVLLAGLLTSLSPCTLSVLPLTIGYIGGYAADSTADGTSQAPNMTVQAVSFSLGLASTLAALGVASSALGRAYGQIGNELPIAVSLVAILMGLNLLEVVQLQLPNVDVDVRQLPVPAALQAYLTGATFALAASPCSTPILASLLAYVSTASDPLQGGSLLLAYTTGYVAPLLLAASFTGAIKQLLSLRRYSAWITPASGALLVAGGTYTLLSRLFP